MEREEERELHYWAERCGLAEEMKLALTAPDALRCRFTHPGFADEADAGAGGDRKRRSEAS